MDLARNLHFYVSEGTHNIWCTLTWLTTPLREPVI
jgi:hypothetical protein